jgi:hypothetical protein
MRLYRWRRRRKRVVVRVELDPTEIAAFVERGCLEPNDRENEDLIEEATDAFISDALMTM